MTHQAIQDLVWRLQDRELGDADRAAVQAHLAGCSDCSEIVRRAGVLHRLLATAPHPAPSEAFVASVMQRLPDAEPAWQPVARPHAWSNWWSVIERVGLGVAAAGLMLAITVRQQPAVATETLLRADWPEQEGWAFADESPDAHLLLASAVDR